MDMFIQASRLSSIERAMSFDRIGAQLEKDWNDARTWGPIGSLTIFRSVPAFLALVTLPRLAISQDEFAACQRLTHTALAIERYRLKHSQLPSTLDDLVPDFLDAIPLDPFTARPLIFEVRGKNFVLRSQAAYSQALEAAKRLQTPPKLREELTVSVEPHG
jgi:hypothetical protein